MPGTTGADILSSAASSAMPQTSPTPQTNPAQALMEIISKLSGGGDSKAPLTTTQTAMPTPQMPQAPMPIQQPSTALGPFGSTGERKRADRQAILSGIASFAQSAITYQHEKKVREAASLYERVGQLMQGMEQAKARGEEGKADYEHNRRLLADIFADNKKAKMIEKGFNVKILGDDKGKATPEHQGLQKYATKLQQEEERKKAGEQRVEQFTQQMPTVQGINPQLQMQIEAIKAGALPKAGELIKANVEVYKSIQQAQSSVDRNAALERAAQIRADAEQYHADKILDAANAKVLGQEDAAKIRYQAEKYKADKVADTWDNRLSVENDKLKANKYYQGLRTKAQALNQALKTLATDDEKMQAELDKKGSSIWGIKLGAASGPDAARIRTQMGNNSARRKAIMQQLDNITSELDTIDPVSMSDVSKGGSGATKDEPLPPPSDDEGDDE